MKPKIKLLIFSLLFIGCEQKNTTIKKQSKIKFKVSKPEMDFKKRDTIN